MEKRIEDMTRQERDEYLQSMPYYIREITNEQYWRNVLGEKPKISRLRMILDIFVYFIKRIFRIWQMRLS